MQLNVAAAVVSLLEARAALTIFLGLPLARFVDLRSHAGKRF
jgi:hypothetical protein